MACLLSYLPTQIFSSLPVPSDSWPLFLCHLLLLSCRVQTTQLSKISVPLTVYCNVVSCLANVLLHTHNDVAQTGGGGTVLQ